MIRNFSKIRSLRQFTADSQEVQIVSKIRVDGFGSLGLQGDEARETVAEALCQESWGVSASETGGVVDG